MWNKLTDTHKPPQIQEALGKAVSFLRRRGIPYPRLEAEVLLASLLQVDRTRLIIDAHRPLSLPVWETYQASFQKRGEGCPLPYLTGKQEFMSLEFLVNQNTLIPRGDTEVLVEKVLAYREESPLPFEIRSIADVGTGSGAIGVSLAYYWPGIQVTATDISPLALTVARENAQRHGVQVEFILGDLLTPFLETGRRFDLIVSNPPYVATQELDTLAPEVRREPLPALDGGSDGLDYYRRLAAQGALCLPPGGILALEIGWDQGGTVKELLRQAGFQDIEIGQDYGGRDRIITGSSRGIR